MISSSSYIKGGLVVLSSQILLGRLLRFFWICSQLVTTILSEKRASISELPSLDYVYDSKLEDR